MRIEIAGLLVLFLSASGDDGHVVGEMASGGSAAEAVLVLDLDRLFRRLPAVARAKLTWTRLRIDAGLGRLLNDPLDDALLDEVAQELRKGDTSRRHLTAALDALNVDNVPDILQAQAEANAGARRTGSPTPRR